MEEILIFSTVLLPIILAVVELVKRTFSVKKNYLPLIAVVIGLVIGVIATPFTDLDLVLRIWSGGLAGLSATGLFELGAKRTGVTKSSN
ncbi:holin [Cytobacillus sp. FSL R5-0569]|uniref:holin n=1 Tax=Cytobacillus sp. FSL R5-0569 TaxID=2921649 RepID=UPI0030F55B2A